MKTRTCFELSYNGVVRCNCGCLEDFAKDLNEFIVPILGSTIRAEFNGRTIVVNYCDNADAIRERFKNEMMWV